MGGRAGECLPCKPGYGRFWSIKGYAHRHDAPTNTRGGVRPKRHPTPTPQVFGTGLCPLRLAHLPPQLSGDHCSLSLSILRPAQTLSSSRLPAFRSSCPSLWLLLPFPSSFPRRPPTPPDLSGSPFLKVGEAQKQRLGRGRREERSAVAGGVSSQTPPPGARGGGGGSRASL